MLIIYFFTFGNGDNDMSERGITLPGQEGKCRGQSAIHHGAAVKLATFI